MTGLVAGEMVKTEDPRTGRDLEGRSAPVKLWATIGAVSLAVVLSGWARWLASPDAKASPTGSDPFTGANLVYLRVVEFGTFAVALYILWRVLLRPVIRERNLTFDGTLLIAMMTTWFYDPIDNYWNFSFIYNPHFINLGSWANFIPGWSAPNMERFPEPLFFIGGAYVWFLYGASVIGCAVLRYLHRLFPTWGIIARFTALLIGLTILDTAVEFFFIVPQLWAYPGAPQGWFTLFSGTRFQFPLWEPILIGVWACGMTAIRYLRDDRGRSFAERGIDHLRISTRRKKVVSTLALTGIMHTWIWVGYFFPFVWLIALKADTMPEVPSYYRSGICGAGTQYACPSEFVPIPGRDSIPIGPDDPRLPQSVRDRQGFPTPSR